jgi:uncharacterized sodium:solute symporter family permease YidK
MCDKTHLEVDAEKAEAVFDAVNNLRCGLGRLRLPSLTLLALGSRSGSDGLVPCP